MKQTEINIYDLEQLNDAAEYIISSAQFTFPNFDDDGNYITHIHSPEERHAYLTDWLGQSKTHYLCFRENEELHKLSFNDALEIPLSEVKGKYLKDYLRKLRNILRKGTTELGYVVSQSVPDEYLDNLLALRWKENLKLWTIQWQHKK